MGALFQTTTTFAGSPFSLGDDVICRVGSDLLPGEVNEVSDTAVTMISVFPANFDGQMWVQPSPNFVNTSDPTTLINGQFCRKP